MRRMAIMVVLGLLAFAMPAFAEQKLTNITEDTLADDSYRPVAGKEFMVAIKLIDVDIELNTEQPLSNEIIVFQTSVGTISETEVTTNIYGEAITWLTTDTTPDTSHNITASVKDKPEITSITIDVKNIALPQDAPKAEELINKVQLENAKIIDMITEVNITSDEPWRPANRRIKTWEKGEKLKIQEISPSPGIYIRPVIAPPGNPPNIIKETVVYNPISVIYVIKSKPETQTQRYPVYYDYIDFQKGVINRKESISGESDNIAKTTTDYINYQQIQGIWVLKDNELKIYQGIDKVVYSTKYLNISTQINTGIPDSEFNQ